MVQVKYFRNGPTSEEPSVALKSLEESINMFFLVKEFKILNAEHKITEFKENDKSRFASDKPQYLYTAQIFYEEIKR